MNARERISALLEGKRPDRLVFCPAIYEHKARLIGKSPGEVAQSEDLLRQALLAEYETYTPDMLTVGIDIYNIEAEAMGATVSFPADSNKVPSLASRIVKDVDDASRLVVPNPQADGRMPLLLETAAAVNQALGKEVFVRGSIAGPFSVAAELMGIEPLLIACICEPEKVASFLEFCTQAAIAYGRAYLVRGVQVCIFDSQSAPPLVSPAMYADLILPHVKKLIQELHDSGAKFVEYVVGGDTSENASNIIATGADIVLSDFVSDAGAFMDCLQGKKTLLRRNISPAVIELGSLEDIQVQAREAASLARRYSNVIIGTGVVSYNTPIEKIKLTRSIFLGEF